MLTRISHGSRLHRTGTPKKSPLALPDAIFGMDTVAYAMHRTKMFFDKEALKDNQSAAARKWLDANREFEAMPIKKKIAWQERVIRKYPPLEELVVKLPAY